MFLIFSSEIFLHFHKSDINTLTQIPVFNNLKVWVQKSEHCEHVPGQKLHYSY